MTLLSQQTDRLKSGIFITFSGNCKAALTFYQSCFGGSLHFETFGREIAGCPESPVVSGSLVSDGIVIHGSDLVHNEGRKIGNYVAVFLLCKHAGEREMLAGKLEMHHMRASARDRGKQKLIEVTDAFDVKWVLGI